MKIFELEQATGLDRATIRYYEKEGFITPLRLENGYRDYSKEDQEHLLKIKLLRQLGISLDRIRKLQQGSEDFSLALSDQIKVLERQIQSSQRAKAVCQQMYEARERYETMDARAYLEILSAPMTPSMPKIYKTFTEPAAIPEPHPWRRYFARRFDYALLATILEFLIIVVLRIRPYEGFPQLLVSYGTPFLAVPLMALMLHFWGYTLGKWLFGIEVADSAGGRLSISEAIMREWNALRYGYGFGIPFWSLWRLYKTYRAYTESSTTDWDHEMSCEYVCHAWRGKRKLTLALLIVLLLALGVFCASDMTMPTYRGDLTVAQFAENYNDLMEILIDDESYCPLKEDGTRNKLLNSGGAIVVIGSNSENADYIYKTENGKITKIILDNTWTDVFFLNPMGSIAQMPAITLLLSQKNASIFDLEELIALWEENEGNEVANFQCRNIEVSWKIETENCHYLGSYYTIVDSEKESSLKLHLEITIH